MEKNLQQNKSTLIENRSIKIYNMSLGDNFGR